MDKKIKSVKLKNDYRDENHFFPSGMELKINVTGSWTFEGKYWVSNYEVLNNKTDLFDIEYEPETKSITVKIEYEADDLMTSGTVRGAICGFGYATNYKNIQVTEVTND